ncbi:MAG: hypothetical protein AAF589_07320 [Planctomycetota bacterium]
MKKADMQRGSVWRGGATSGRLFRERKSGKATVMPDEKNAKRWTNTAGAVAPRQQPAPWCCKIATPGGGTPCYLAASKSRILTDAGTRRRGRP